METSRKTNLERWGEMGGRREQVTLAAYGKVCRIIDRLNMRRGYRPFMAIPSYEDWIANKVSELAWTRQLQEILNTRQVRRVSWLYRGFSNIS